VIVISFALPEESKELVRKIAGARRSGQAVLPVITGKIAGRDVTVVHSGMGMASATAQMGRYLEAQTPALWIAAGFGGGLVPDVAVGDVVVAENFSDPALLAAIAGQPARRGALVTTKQVIETVEHKKDLGRHTGAVVVDMETAAIQRLCAPRGIPMLAIRAISDGATQDLPVPASVWFDTAKQRPRPFRLLFYLATHPARIGPFARFVGGVNRARASLTAFLLAALPALPEK
jgi:adenosylhomocysteine nucleosidase